MNMELPQSHQSFRVVSKLVTIAGLQY
jgi:hypothetical protein